MCTFAEEQMNILLELEKFGIFYFFVFLAEVIYFLLDLVFLCSLHKFCIISADMVVMSVCLYVPICKSSFQSHLVPDVSHIF